MMQMKCVQIKVIIRLTYLQAFTLEEQLRGFRWVMKLTDKIN